MASSSAATVAEYLAALAPGRRKVVCELRKFVNLHLPMGYQEALAWGMLSWQIPLAR